MMHKSGFVNIIGKPNVGKSTLINALVGEKLSIVTPKIQTTRHRILGILSTEDYQIVFSDTPGIIDQPRYRLQEHMMRFVKEAVEDADVIIYMVTPEERPAEGGALLQSFQRTGKPVLLVLNKIDLMNQDDVVRLMEAWVQYIPQEFIIPLSALKGFNTQSVVQAALKYLPEGPAYYDKEQFTDRSERFIVSELIREKIFIRYRQEIPYSTEVAVISFQDEPTILRISAEIIVNRASQKPILIGKGGEGLKRVGTDVRKELEKLYDKKVFLELYVKIREDWRENKNMLRQFGYEG